MKFFLSWFRLNSTPKISTKMEKTEVSFQKVPPFIDPIESCQEKHVSGKLCFQIVFLSPATRAFCIFDHVVLTESPVIRILIFLQTKLVSIDAICVLKR